MKWGDAVDPVASLGDAVDPVGFFGWCNPPLKFAGASSINIDHVEFSLFVQGTQHNWFTIDSDSVFGRFEYSSIWSI